MAQSAVMTIGRLSRRTRTPIKALREYERLGFIYTLGRSAGNYRLFGEEAVWCVRMIQGLRSLGLTLKDIQELVRRYLERPGEPVGDLLAEPLARAFARVESRIAALQSDRQRILEFRAGASESAVELTRLLASDPRRAG